MKQLALAIALCSLLTACSGKPEKLVRKPRAGLVITYDEDQFGERMFIRDKRFAQWIASHCGIVKNVPNPNFKPYPVLKHPPNSKPHPVPPEQTDFGLSCDADRSFPASAFKGYAIAPPSYIPLVSVIQGRHD